MPILKVINAEEQKGSPCEARITEVWGVGVHNSWEGGGEKGKGGEGEEEREG